MTARDDSRDFAKSVAITSSIYPDPDTHIEVVTYGRGGDAMSRLFTTMTGEGTRLTRPAALDRRRCCATRCGRPRLLWPRKWSRRTVILLVMQTTDTAMRLVPKRRLFGRGVRLQTEQDPERPNPTFLPAAEKATLWFADRIGGIPQSGITESTLNIPTTAHILGGAVIGPDPERGVVDADNRAYGYENLLVCDGAAIPANPGVNPSLTITAVAEHAMGAVPPKDGAGIRPTCRSRPGRRSWPARDHADAQRSLRLALSGEPNGTVPVTLTLAPTRGPRGRSCRLR